MGSGNSTRRVTVINENENFLKLSESVVERLKEGVEKERESSSQKNSSEPRTDQSRSPSPPRTSSAVNYIPEETHQQASGQSDRYVTMDTLRLRQQHQHELDMIQRHHHSKVEQLEQQNRLLYESSKARLENKLSQVEEKYISSHRHEPVCVEAQRNVEFCYNDNHGMPLKCSKVAKEFINCVDSIRRQVINEAS